MEPSRSNERVNHLLHTLGLNDSDDRWMECIRSLENGADLGSHGTYDLEAEIGHGGQAVVYRARARSTGEVVALKVLRAGSLATPTARRRLEREWAICSSLNHKGIVRVLGLEAIEGRLSLAMEWVEGVRIDRWAEQGSSGRRPLHQILTVAEDIARAVHHAHQRGVIHRDLKPSNILVSPEGQACILDFGLAKGLDPSDPSQDDPLSRSGEFLGTPAYAAPEAWSRAPLGDVRSDVFSLGVILLELVTGHRPDRRSAEQSSVLRAVPPGLRAVLRSALAEDIDSRTQSAGAMADDLARIQAGKSPTACGPTRVERFLRGLVATRLRVLLTSLSVIGFAATLVLFIGLSIKLAERTRALQESHRVSAAANRALEELFCAGQQLGINASVGMLVDVAAESLDRHFSDDPAVLARLRSAIGRGMATTGRWAEAEIPLRQSLEYFRAHSKTHRLEHARCAAVLASVAALLGHPDARELAIEACRVLPADVSVGLRAWVQTQRAYTLWKAGNESDLEHARALLVKAIPQLGGPEGSTARYWLAGLLSQLGEGDAARATLLALRDELDPGPLQSACLYELGQLEARSGHFDLARKTLESALPDLERYYAPPFSRSLRWDLAEVCLHCGEPERAWQVLQSGYNTFLLAETSVDRTNSARSADRWLSALSETRPTASRFTQSLRTWYRVARAARQFELADEVLRRFPELGSVPLHADDSNATRSFEG